MIFARFALAEAEGLRLAHSLSAAGRKLRKGHVLTREDIALLGAAAIESVLGARLGEDDVDEDRAAACAAALLAGDHLEPQAAAQGRCNLRATADGLLVVDAAAIARLNRIDEALTVGTLPAFSAVSKGQVTATVKTIAFAVASRSIAAWRQEATAAAVMRIAPLARQRVALICSAGDATTDKLLDATEAVTRRRIESLGSELGITARCAHDEQALRTELQAALAAGAQMILVAGAAVSKDRGDTVPAAIVAAGGDIVHFGMPVEPGNMLLLARIGTVPVINLPGCARSPRTNGLDWVLQRLLAGLPLSGADIMAMGVGGLILSSATAASRRNAPAPSPPRIAALVLAAGRSSRMGETNKLLSVIDGLPMLLHAVNAATASRCVQTLVVSGHDAAAVEALVTPYPVSLVRNGDYAAGMSTSLSCGLRALPQDLDGVVVLLADMPRVTTAHIDRLIAAMDLNQPAIVVPEKDGRRGNPVLWPRRHFAAMLALSGDQGARGLIDRHADEVLRVVVEDDAIFTDVDTPAALAKITAVR